ncbi:DUF2750 domain-containing protein [Litoribacillus peritrichatus]|uniref:DUF2750 domain-containing protein n=1 Tax=Litoribacillus peritrichatus TaxID=718191 RepID=A0ABP7MGU3_9GAMM
MQLEDIQKLSCEDRYNYFLSVVGEEREIWILVNEEKQFLKIFSEDEGFEYLPVWPSLEFAQVYCESVTETLKPKNIGLPEFFKKWVPGLQGDGLEVGVFPGSDATVWIMAPSEIKDDIQDELSSGW